MIKKLQALRAKKGFTLVELIVVIAIIGVLAAILVPTMMGMVTKSRVTSADATASKLKDSVGTWMIELDTAGLKAPETATISITNSGATAGDGDSISDDAIALLTKKITDDYDFANKTVSATVYIVDRKAVACAYTDNGATIPEDMDAATLRSGHYGWTGSADGTLSDGGIIGTYPKCVKATGGNNNDDNNENQGG